MTPLFEESHGHAQTMEAVGDDDRLRALQACLRDDGNPLIAAAAPLLDLIVVLGAGARHESPLELRMQVAGEIREFHRRLERKSVSLHSVRVASYALCGALDEAVLTCEWGSESDWGMDTLLWTFHHDSTGGENIFKYVTDLALSPDAPVELVEFLVLLLDFGFQGHHRISDKGSHALESTRLRLHAVVRSHRPDPVPPVGSMRAEVGAGSTRWPSILKAFTLCAALALGAAWAVLYVRTQSLVAPVHVRIEQLTHDYRPASVPAAAPAVPAGS